MKKASLLAAALTAAVCVGFTVSSYAQVEVVESSNRLLMGSSPRQVAAPPATASDGSSELFYQLQTLQQEVLELRGLVEEQAYELKRLKQQRLDDYVSFDRRLGGLTGQNSSAQSTAAGEGDSSADFASNSAQGAPAADEVQSYRTAIDLVLRKKDYAQAVISFEKHLRDFPNGRYAPNSQYWLGEIFLLQGDLEQARTWFARLLSDYSDHAKAADATYKLGVVYDKLGDGKKARELLQQVSSGNANAARLATAYLSEMNARSSN